MLLALFSAGILSCSSSKKDFKKVSNVSASRVSAFPGAEGFGKFTVGGRYGKVLLVANLNDNGPGSFRSAAEAEFPRIIVFSVSGTIHLQNKIKIKGDVTIAGQSAPGTGICIADQSVLLGGDNIIVRFLRFRMGDKFQKGGMVDGNGGDDAFGGLKRKNIIIDHCSLSWSTDEVFSVYAGDSTSIQWNLIAEPLNYSYHFETGDSDYEHHGYGAIWGGVHASFHHNLFAHCNSRTPRFNGIRHTQEENCDFRNNVIYNWGGNNVYGGEGGHYNIVGNFYKAGPSTSKKSRSNLVTPFRRKDIPFGKWYVEGNLLEGNEMVSRKNQLGVKLNEPMPEDQLNNVLVNTAFDFMSGVTQDPQNAYNEVLSKSGCILPQRDTLDERIVGDVMNGKGKLIDVQGDYPHGTDYAQTVNAWPFLLQTSAMADTDEDGMPNDWEEKNGLNPKQNDAMLFQLDKQYTNVEVYLNSLVR
jgi:hypothetical protein